MFDGETWRRCVQFHGHECPGLAIGVKAVEGARAQLGLVDDLDLRDARLACVAENDVCPVDAVRFLLGCTEEKGNLTVRPTGEMAFTFSDAASGKTVRLVLKPGVGAGMARPEKIAYMLAAPYEELFEVADSRESE